MGEQTSRSRGSRISELSDLFLSMTPESQRPPLPRVLEPTTVETFQVSSGVVHVPKCVPRFRLWTGEPPGDSYGGKPILHGPDGPAFAELVVLGLLREGGWDGVWVDTYRNRFRTSYWGEDRNVPLPTVPAGALARILECRGQGWSGTWDVFVWRGPHVLFAECKRAGKDQIRPSQTTFLDAALREQFPLQSFLVVEWSATSASARTSHVV